ncbi:hypothetical protein ACFLSJ_05435 [Verrucomicrobiota bacterium]
MKTLLRCACVVVVVGMFLASQTGVWAAETLPYDTGFETTDGYNVGDAPGAPAFTVGGGGRVVVTNGAGHYCQGSQGCVVNGDSLTLGISGNLSKRSNIWVHVWTKPTPSSEEPDVSGVSAAFCLSSNGNLRTYVDNLGADEWVTQVSGLATDAWYGFAAHLDYAAEKWDLFYTASSYGAIMSKANASPMDFPSSANTLLEEFIIESGHDAFVDAVVATLGAGTVQAGTPDQMAEEFDVTLGTFGPNGGMAAGNIGFYMTDSDVVNLDAEGGLILLCALSIGDKVHFWDPATASFDTYTVVDIGGGEKAWSPTPAGGTHENMMGTTGYWIETAGLTECTDHYDVPHDSTTPASVTLYGTASAAGGWSCCAWPYAARRQGEGAGWGFPAVSGDAILVWDSAAGYVMLMHNGSSWTYLGGVSSYQLQQGQGFWYRRSTVANATWNVGSVQ